MRARARLRLGDGPSVDLHPGDLIGRLRSAALRVNDGRVSEAHAMVSLRGRDLKLLALRGRMAVSGAQVTEVVLTPGLEVAIARDLVVVVECVDLPAQVMGLRAGDRAAQVLSGVTSLYGGNRPRMLSGWRNDAAAHVWPDGDGWRYQLGDQEAALGAGDSLDVDGASFTAEWMGAGDTAVPVTEHLGGIQAPLRIVARFDSVHLIRSDSPVIRLTGLQARLVSELVACAAPVGWLPLARTLWRDGDPHVLRRRWDVLLARLRGRLREAGIRSDLVRADGLGQVELVVGDGDVVVDET